MRLASLGRFTTEELFLGARLQFRSRTLEIDAVDDYSMAYTHMSLPEILGLLRQKIQEKNVNLHETFRSYDDDHSQGLTYDEFHDALRGTNLNLEDLLTKRDVLSLFRHFDKDNSGLISYLEFCNGIQEANPFDAQMDSNYVNPHEQFTVSKMTEEEVSERSGGVDEDESTSHELYSHELTYITITFGLLIRSPPAQLRRSRSTFTKYTRTNWTVGRKST